MKQLNSAHIPKKKNLNYGVSAMNIRNLEQQKRNTKRSETNHSLERCREFLDRGSCCLSVRSIDRNEEERKEYSQERRQKIKQKWDFLQLEDRKDGGSGSGSGAKESEMRIDKQIKEDKNKHPGGDAGEKNLFIFFKGKISLEKFRRRNGW